MREMQIKATMRYNLRPVRMGIIYKIPSAGRKRVKKLASVCIVGRNVKWYNRCGQQYGSSSKN